ncbi:hypothetical protein ElyMa_002703500 [Elysia marginata]|uniref:Uncharacterized protein n=1 Tax=Elysia marginata TaxID=1093978 RepID=A0AAV4HFI4_9GAST|nr:hypothetical protein ElyMa_002703500 [Elysia marginata]
MEWAREGEGKKGERFKVPRKVSLPRNPKTEVSGIFQRSVETKIVKENLRPPPSVAAFHTSSTKKKNLLCSRFHAVSVVKSTTRVKLTRAEVRDKSNLRICVFYALVIISRKTAALTSSPMQNLQVTTELTLVWEGSHRNDEHGPFIRHRKRVTFSKRDSC